jgi:hypothetical protein
MILALFINFVRQEPTAAYSASGTTLTLTSATSATDDMYCVYLRSSSYKLLIHQTLVLEQIS